SSTSSRGANCTPILTSTSSSRASDGGAVGPAGTNTTRRAAARARGPPSSGRLALQREAGDATPVQRRQQLLGLVLGHLAATGQPELRGRLGRTGQPGGEQLGAGPAHPGVRH